MEEKEAKIVRVGQARQMAGLLLALMGIILAFFSRVDLSIGGFIAFVVLGLVYFVMGRRMASKPNKYISDERSIRIKEKSGYYAFKASIYPLIIIIGLCLIRLPSDLIRGLLIGVLLMYFLGWISFLIFHFYLSRKEV